MKKTFVTSLKDTSGAFLSAVELVADLGLNITRVSYNKSVDVHTLFFQVEGDEKLVEEASNKLLKLGYIADPTNQSKVILLDFKIDNKPGELLHLLTIIARYKFNISYINSHANDFYHTYRIGLFVDNADLFMDFLAEIKNSFSLEIIDYDSTEISYDNNSFYVNYVDELSKNANLKEDMKSKLAVNINRVLSLLENRNLPAKTTFDYISKFASHIVKHKGENFVPRIRTYNITDTYSITSIEPPCGSNTYIIKQKDKFLFVDSGYSVYKNEMLKIFDVITGGFDKIEKKVFVTHADADHSGLLYLFDEIYASDKTKQCFELEVQNKKGLREQNPLHLPYVRICKILSAYTPPNPDKVKVIAKYNDSQDSLLYFSSNFMFNGLHFDVYCGQGGHLQGETILMDSEHKLVFAGDIFVNLKDYTPEQAVYNQYAPILMSSVDTNPTLAKYERLELMKMLTKGKWLIFGGHGGVKEIIVE